MDEEKQCGCALLCDKFQQLGLKCIIFNYFQVELSEGDFLPDGWVLVFPSPVHTSPKGSFMSFDITLNTMM